MTTRENPNDVLAELRGVPPIGAWAVLDSMFAEDAFGGGEWHPSPCRPSEWFHTRDLAEAAARQRPEPTWIAQVVRAEPNGWTTGEEHLIPKKPIRVHGSLADLLDVYHGPTADGVHQVHVTLRTSDGRGEGVARSVVSIEPDTSPARIAAIVHEQALALLAHELLECIGTEDGRPMLDPHAGGRLVTMPEVDAPMFRRVRDRLGLTGTCSVSYVVPGHLSHTNETRRKEGQVDAGVAEFVRRLNHPIFGDDPITEQSCDGHGRTRPTVQLVGDETAVIVPTKDVGRVLAALRPAIGRSGASA